MKRRVTTAVATVTLAVALVVVNVGPVVVGTAAETVEGEDCSFARAAATDVTAPQPDLDVTATRTTADGDPVVRYRVAFDVPAGTTALSATAWNASWITDATGFDRRDGRLVWTGTARPTLVLTVPAADAGPDWAFAHAPLTAYRWTAGDAAHCTYSMDDETPRRIDATGADHATTSGSYAFLSDGGHEVAVERAGGTTYRLVFDRTAVPASFDSAAIRQTITRTAGDLEANASVERATLFALPETASDQAETRWMGWAPGKRTVRLNANEPVGDAGNAWVHELVHTRQSFDLGPRMRWLVEGSSRYYSVLLAAEQPRATPGAARQADNGLFADAAAGERTRLADPETWHAGTEYDEGGRVLLELDARLRETTDGEATVSDLLRWLNSRDDTVTYPEFRRAVVRYGDQDTARWLDRHVLANAAYRPLPRPGSDAPVRDGVAT